MCLWLTLIWCVQMCECTQLNYGTGCNTESGGIWIDEVRYIVLKAEQSDEMCMDYAKGIGNCAKSGGDWSVFVHARVRNDSRPIKMNRAARKSIMVW